ncbi:MAG TPA: heme-binding protein [Stellaceae bacterium]|nr:heme-binding protein [Stellaceae bacterium]
MAKVSVAAVRGVDLATAAKIVDHALATARQRKLRPMTIAVLDSGGDLIAFKREDGTGIRRCDVVMGKAFGSLVMNRSSRAIGKIAENAPMFIQSLAVATQGRLVPTPGGVLIKNQAGEIIGAVGSSGDEADEDEACAILAVRAAGFVPEPAEPQGAA